MGKFGIIFDAIPREIDDLAVSSRQCFNSVGCFDSTSFAAIIVLVKNLESFSSLKSQQRGWSGGGREMLEGVGLTMGGHWAGVGLGMTEFDGTGWGAMNGNKEEERGIELATGKKEFVGDGARGEQGTRGGKIEGRWREDGAAVLRRQRRRRLPERDRQCGATASVKPAGARLRVAAATEAEAAATARPRGQGKEWRR